MTLYLILGLGLALAGALWFGARQTRRVGELTQRIGSLEATVTAKDAQLALMVNARPGDGGAALGDGTF